MKRRKAIWVSLVSIFALGTMLLGAIGCPGTTPTVTITDVNTRLTAVETWKGETAIALQARPTRDETNSLIAAAVAGVNAPNLSGYVTATQYNDLLAKYNALEVRVTALEGVGTITPTTGEVTARLVEDSYYVNNNTLQIYSPTVGNVNFSVEITNGTNTTKYVSLCFNLTLQNPASCNVTAATLASWSYSNITMTPNYNPSQAAATLISFYPTGTPTRFPVSKNSTLEVMYMLSVSGAAGQWQGNVVLLGAWDTW